MKDIFISIIILALVVLIILFYIPSKYNIFIGQAKPKFSQLSRLFSIQIDNFFEKEYSKLKLIGQSHFLRVSLFQYQISKKAGRLKKYCKDILNQNKAYKGIYLISTKNKKITHASLKNYDFKINVNKKFHLFFNESDKKHYFYLINELQNSFHKTIAFLLAIFDYDIIALLGNNFSSDEFGYSFIIDNTGHTIYHQLNKKSVNESWTDFNFSKVRETKFFIGNLEGKSQIYSISKCRFVPFYAGIAQIASNHIKSYNAILIIIAGMAAILLAILIMLIFLSPKSTQYGVKLYDAYLENLTNTITQMAKASDRASQSSQLAFEKTKKEVETIKTILNNFYNFMGQRDKRHYDSSPAKGECIKPEPDRLKAEVAGIRNNDFLNRESIKQESKKLEKMPAEAERESSKKEKAKEEKPSSQPKQLLKQNSKLPKSKYLKNWIDKSKIEEKKHKEYPSTGIIEENGIIKEGEIDQKDLKNIKINNKLIKLDNNSVIEDGLIEQNYQTIFSEINEGI